MEKLKLLLDLVLEKQIEDKEIKALIDYLDYLYPQLTNAISNSETEISILKNNIHKLEAYINASR